MMRNRFVSIPILLIPLYFMLFSPTAVQAADIGPDCGRLIEVSRFADAGSEVYHLIESGEYAGASVLANKIITDNSGASDFPDALFCLIAEQCRWSDSYEQEKNFYRRIIQDYPESPYLDKAELNLLRADIQSLILSKDYGKADKTIDRLLRDFAGHEALPDALYWIAERYRWGHQWQQANGIYQQIIKDYPDSPYALRAKLAIARAEVLSLIIAKDYDRAGQTLDELIIDFAGYEDLPETLYWIAERYRWEHKWEQVQSLYSRIVQDWPGSLYADKAELGLARAEVLILIIAKNFGPADKAIDRMITDFADHTDLPKSLYQIARGYEWTSEYERAKKIHELVAGQYIDNKFAERARLGIYRTQAGILITSGKTEDANTIVEKIKSDFTENPDYTDTLYEIARVYDYVDSIEQAAEMHSGIVTDYPQDKFCSKAAIERARLAVLELIDTGRFEDANEAVAQMQADFAGHEMLCSQLELIAEEYDKAGELPEAVALYNKIIQNCDTTAKESMRARAGLDRYELFAVIDSGDDVRVEKTLNELGNRLVNGQGLDEYLNTLAKQCYSEARWSVIEDNNDRADTYYRAALRLRERVFIECPNSPLAPLACFCAAVIAQQELGHYGKALNYFQRVSTDWPGYEHAPWALLKVADSIGLASQRGYLDPEAARFAETAILNSVIDKYPQDRRAIEAQEQLEYYRQVEQQEDIDHSASCGE